MQYLHSTFFFKGFIAWGTGFALLTILSGMIYATVQQDLRQSANDPQIQAAEDVAASIDKGSDPSSFDVAQNDRVDIAKSLSPYAFIYDTQGKVLAATGELNGEVPSIPLPALQASTEQNENFFQRLRRDGGEDRENRLTWQPELGVRSAIVVVPFAANGGGYVVAGRSLREVEFREDHTLKIVVLGWFLMMSIWTLFFALWFLLHKHYRLHMQ